jgi:glyoxylase-like metal-dependent hydrolase (beta-lactamase superfamily II)
MAAHRQTPAAFMVLVPVPAFQDNYIWVWHDGARAVVVDPGQSDGIEAYLANNRLQLDTILVTHHHGDHEESDGGDGINARTSHLVSSFTY